MNTDTTETRSIFCVTNTMHDFRACTHRDAHEITCDGFAYAWNETRGREEATGKRCKGCLPREARHGHLCLSCWLAVETALSEWPEFEGKIDGLERAVQRDNGGISGQSVGYVPIPGTALALDELRSYTRSLYGAAKGDMQVWVSTVDGAKDARRFARALTGALRTHSIEEKSFPLRRLHCPECKQLSFVRNPPADRFGDITVTCQNQDCKKTIREHETTADGVEKLDIIASIEDRRGKVPAPNIRTGGRQEFADVYDPTREDHADLDPLSILTKADLRKMLDPDHPRLGNLTKPELIDAVRKIA